MKTRHTPGPWAIEADADKAGRHPLHDNRHVTARTGVVCDLRDQPAQAADARLIAAAPDLLAALKFLRGVYMLTGDHSDPRHHEDGCALCAATEAITKAEEG